MIEDSAQPMKLGADWKLPKAWGEWAKSEHEDWSDRKIRSVAQRFHEHHTLKGNTRNSAGEWELAWRYWVRGERKSSSADEEKKSQGQLCAMDGCSNHGTCANQGGGPWYCREHYFNRDIQN